MSISRRLRDNFKRVIQANSAMIGELCRLSAVQCQSYGSLNVRRLVQIVQLYKKLYNEKSVYGLLRNFSNRWPVFAQSGRTVGRLIPRGLGGGALLSASIFSFSQHGIADEDMIEAASLLTEIASKSQPATDSSAKNALLLMPHDESENWEVVSTQQNFHVWRRSSPNANGLYEYKCAGQYFDVPAYGFYVAQMDLEYRKQWDRLVIYLDVVESDSETGSEVIRWVTHFPFPMCPREYVYVRRSCIDPSTKSIVLTSKTVDHHRCPRDDAKFVRVDEYYSRMVIKPHGDDFKQNGFDYVLTYFDDPKAPFPSLAYNWMVTTGVPNFVQKVYNAAKAFNNRPSLENANSATYRPPILSNSQNLTRSQSSLLLQ